MLQRTIPRLESLNAGELAETSRKLTELGLKLFAKSMDPGNGLGKANLDDPP